MLFVWGAADIVAVSDVDGTVTKSDIGGMLNTTILQKAGAFFSVLLGPFRSFTPLPFPRSRAHS